jgi:hypothetical protein
MTAAAAASRRRSCRRPDRRGPLQSDTTGTPGRALGWGFFVGARGASMAPAPARGATSPGRREEPPSPASSRLIPRHPAKVAPRSCAESTDKSRPRCGRAFVPSRTGWPTTNLAYRASRAGSLHARLRRFDLFEIALSVRTPDARVPHQSAFFGGVNSVKIVEPDRAL